MTARSTQSQALLASMGLKLLHCCPLNMLVVKFDPESYILEPEPTACQTLPACNIGAVSPKHEKIAYWSNIAASTRT